MRYFLDSAKLDEIVYAHDNWGIDGVTTNPRHILSSGKPFRTVVGELADRFSGEDFPISVEINPHLERADEMVDQAVEIAALSDNFAIKIPCTEQGLVAARRLSAREVKTNVTLVFSPSQALAAARAGARFVSPFIGWKETSGEPTMEFIDTCVTILANYGFETEIIVAAVRNGHQIASAALCGADIVTAGYDVFRDSFEHPFTRHGIDVFSDAWDRTEAGQAGQPPR
jgi:transaldolase